MPILFLANFCAVISCTLSTISTFLHTKRKMIIMMIIGCFVDICAELLIWSVTGAIVAGLALIRYFVGLNRTLYRKVWVLFVLVAIILGIAFNTVGLAGYVAIAGIVQYTIWLAFADTPQAMRYGLFINLLIWGVYDFMVDLYLYTAFYAVELVIDTVNIYRNRNGELSTAGNK